MRHIIKYAHDPACRYIFRHAGSFMSQELYQGSEFLPITPCANHKNSLYLIRYGRLEVRRDV